MHVSKYIWQSCHGKRISNTNLLAIGGQAALSKKEQEIKKKTWLILSLLINSRQMGITGATKKKTSTLKRKIQTLVLSLQKLFGIPEYYWKDKILKIEAKYSIYLFTLLKSFWITHTWKFQSSILNTVWRIFFSKLSGGGLGGGWGGTQSQKHQSSHIKVLVDREPSKKRPKEHSRE